MLGGQPQSARCTLHELALIVLSEDERFSEPRRRGAGRRIAIEGAERFWRHDATPGLL